MLISLAWKNIWRNKKRSLIVFAAIIFGLWGGLISGAIMMGFGESMVNSAIDRDLSHIQLHKKRYSENKEITDFIPDALAIMDTLRNMSAVSNVAGRTVIEGMGASPASVFGVKIIGIDPSESMKVTDIHKKLIEGNYFETNDRNPVVIGSKLAERLKLKLRSKIVLSFQGLDGSIIYTACRVVGIFKTESSMFDEMHLFALQKDLFRLLNTEPVIHEIAVRVKSARLLPAAYGEIKSDFEHLSVMNWMEIAPEIAFTASYMEGFTYLFVAIILLALLFGITNTMLMSVVERVRELGILIAVGMKRSKVFMMILWETIMLSVTGGILGMITGGVTIFYYYRSGMDFSIVADSMASFGASAVVYPFLPFSMYIIITFMIIIAANIAAILPAWKAIHLLPSEAIRVY